VYDFGSGGCGFDSYQAHKKHQRLFNLSNYLMRTESGTTRVQNMDIEISLV